MATICLITAFEPCVTWPATVKLVLGIENEISFFLAFLFLCYRVILQTVSSAGVQSFLQDFYSHSGSSSLTIDIEWIKTHSFFSQLDFDQVICQKALFVCDAGFITLSSIY